MELKPSMQKKLSESTMKAKDPKKRAQSGYMLPFQRRK
jgi:hypothetical protein